MFLLISVCLIAHPEQCRDEQIDLSTKTASTAICLRNSQAVLAEWAGDHPDWSIKRWKCAARDTAPKNL